ncbi:MAG TPA: RcnB family protein [Sphingobium sp.]|uniref:RcnB family protein n=1 Tax=Sphingobium sp. TaxID=1912891 RepID=UPI002ED648B5
MKIISALLAASLLSAPALAAPHHDDHGRPGAGRPHAQGPQYRNWRKGERFDNRYARNYRVISRPQSYRLKPAPRGYHWVQSGNDAVLVGITTGIVASVLAGAFH